MNAELINKVVDIAINAGYSDYSIETGGLLSSQKADPRYAMIRKMKGILQQDFDLEFYDQERTEQETHDVKILCAVFDYIADEEALRGLSAHRVVEILPNIEHAIKNRLRISSPESTLAA